MNPRKTPANAACISRLLEAIFGTNMLLRTVSDELLVIKW
jgi:hypothetical protein